MRRSLLPKDQIGCEERNACHIFFSDPYTQARLLKDDTLLLSMCLRYQGMQSAVVHDVGLAPQDGYQVSIAFIANKRKHCRHKGKALMPVAV